MAKKPEPTKETVKEAMLKVIRNAAQPPAISTLVTRVYEAFKKDAETQKKIRHFIFYWLQLAAREQGPFDFTKNLRVKER